MADSNPWAGFKLKTPDSTEKPAAAGASDGADPWAAFKLKKPGDEAAETPAAPAATAAAPPTDPAGPQAGQPFLSPWATNAYQANKQINPAVAVGIGLAPVAPGVLGAAWRNPLGKLVIGLGAEKLAESVIPDEYWKYLPDSIRAMHYLGTLGPASAPPPATPEAGGAAGTW